MCLFLIGVMYYVGFAKINFENSKIKFLMVDYIKNEGSPVTWLRLEKASKT